MNMTLSKRGDYVMRAAIFLARSRGGARKIREVVADTEVPPAFASQILSDLVRAGLATSKAGREGGYRLSRDPARITALEIVEAAEGPLAAERCALGEGPCRWDSVCPLHETWFTATQRLRELLNETTLAELAERDRDIAEGTYSPADSHRRHPSQFEIEDVVQVERDVNTVTAALGGESIRVGDIFGHVAEALAAGAPVETEGAIEPVRASSRTRPPAHDFQVAWRERGGDRACHVEADLSVSALDDERSQVRLHALWHQERVPAPGLDARRHAERTVRLFLRELAATLEGAAQPG